MSQHEHDYEHEHEHEKKNSSHEADESRLYDLNFADLLKGFIKFWWVGIVCALLIGGYFYFVSSRDYVDKYTVSATFTVSTESNSLASGSAIYSSAYDNATAARLSSTFPYIMSSNLLHDIIKAKLNITDIPATISATYVTGSNLFSLTVNGNDPQQIYDILKCAMENYPTVARYIVGNVKLSMITDPEIPTEPSTSFSMSATYKGAAIGIIIGILWIVIFALMRNTIKSKNDIKDSFNLETLGTLPFVSFKKYSREMNTAVLSTNGKVGAPFLESLRVFRNTFIQSVGEDEKVVLVTSTAPGEGKTTVTVNLALSLVEAGKKILLCDSDLRNPSVAPLLGIEPAKLEKQPGNGYSVSYLAEYNIYYMTFEGVEASRGKSFKASRLKRIFNEVRDDYDFVLVDTPPCGLLSDAIVVAQAADAAVYVIKEDTIRISRIRTGIDGIAAVDTKVLGCVMNGAAGTISGYGYGYGYGKYGYGYGYGKYGYGEKKKKSRSKKE